MFQDLNIDPALQWFLTHPLTPTGVRELARHIKTSPATALRNLRDLKARKLVIEEASAYKANTEATTYKALKQSYNLFTIQNSPIVNAITQTCKPDAIIVFGSYARGDDHEQSDIDIAIVTPRATGKLPPTLAGKEISYHPIEWKKISPELRTSIANGITIYGTLVIA